MNHPACSIDGCTKPTRTKSAASCKMHYHRQYRTGSVGGAAERKRKVRNPECAVDGCSKPDKESGLCAMHGARKRRHGDINAVISPEERSTPTGEAHHNWAGDSIGYGGAHARVRHARGAADEHPCIDCGEQALHWSYEHDDPEERHGETPGADLVAYSADPGHYSPRCVSCHKRFDLGRARAMPVG